MFMHRCLRSLHFMTHLSRSLNRPHVKWMPRRETCKLICSSAPHSSLLFEKKVDNDLESLSDQIEEVLSRSQRITDYDVSLSSGVLTINLGTAGAYVINKQSANQQIWLSSPVSGPKRYDLCDGSWIYQRDNQTLDQLLSKEFAALIQESVKIKLE